MCYGSPGVENLPETRQSWGTLGRVGGKGKPKKREVTVELGYFEFDMYLFVGPVY